MKPTVLLLSMTIHSKPNHMLRSVLNTLHSTSSAVGSSLGTGGILIAAPVSYNQWLLPKVKALTVIMIQSTLQMAVMGRWQQLSLFSM
eukprot:11364325-Ditylum_brightwellii.AAC.1